MDPTPNVDVFESRRSTVYGTRGIVATSQPLAAEAGLAVLRDGGNAFDAAVATAATLNVVEATSTGIGGDVFALYRTADGTVGGMQSCGGAPADATIDAVQTALDQRGLPSDEMPRVGPFAVTVPGTARGWEAILDRFGRRTLGDLLDPAIHYATEGFPVSEIVAKQWEGAEDLFSTPHARSAYLVDGERPPRVGEMMRLPELGSSLESIAESGADAFYEGQIADRIAEAVQSAGGFLTTDDLASFQPTFVDPISTTYGGAEVYELPPNNQGQIALEALNIASEIGAGEHPYDSPERVHYFAEALKVAYRDGHYYITDPAFEPVRPLHDPAYAADRAPEIGETALTDIPIGFPGSGGEDADTVYLSVADAEGNVVSFINSRFKGFGSGIVPEGTGIALQNRGWSFSLDPEHPNSLEPGKRPFHTLIPGLMREGDAWSAFGVMGGYMQPQGHLQVVSNIVDYDMPLQAALDQPRWRYRDSGALAVEPRFPENQLIKLARRGHDVTVAPPTDFGGAQIVRYDPPRLSGATEPRKDGTVATF